MNMDKIIFNEHQQRILESNHLTSFLQEKPRYLQLFI